MGSKIPTYIGWAVIAWFVWTNFGGTISGVLGSVSDLGGQFTGSGRNVRTPQPVTPRNTYFRG